MRLAENRRGAERVKSLRGIRRRRSNDGGLLRRRGRYGIGECRNKCVAAWKSDMAFYAGSDWNDRVSLSLLSNPDPLFEDVE